MRNATIASSMGIASRKRSDAVQAQLVPDRFIARLIMNVDEKNMDAKMPTNMALMMLTLPLLENHFQLCIQ
ncbi:hypothetical protein PBN151_1575 [Paenibacillus sp. NAIST15-1]|nr:hypothetical protein PBN151_1575 [Paenibacillus sp. NAIST15-1]